MPAPAKVRSARAPGSRLPVGMASNWPSVTGATLCWLKPVLLHTTFVPGDTFTSWGPKVLSWVSMVTVAWPRWSTTFVSCRRPPPATRPRRGRAPGPPGGSPGPGPASAGAAAQDPIAQAPPGHEDERFHDDAARHLRLAPDPVRERDRDLDDAALVLLDL